MAGRWTLATLALGACSFTPGSLGPNDGNGDGAQVDGIPDAGPCLMIGATCSADTVRTCTVIGQQPSEKACPWGCTSSNGATCAELAPSGGWETPSTGDTTSFAGLMNITLPDFATLSSSDGSISGSFGTGQFRVAGAGVIGGIDYVLRPIGATGRSVAVFRVRTLTIHNLSLTGAYAIAFVADEGITVDGIIDAEAACLSTDTRTPGPGGFAGGLNDFDGLPNPPDGGGVKGPNDNMGGGGGGHGVVGSSGANNPSSGGAPRGDAVISLLQGGSGGGGGDNHANSGHGGGGGGAIHLLANAPIRFTSGFGGLNAGGCGGRAGSSSNDGGGGGGAGGAILIEAPTVALMGTLAANGGGGGGGATGSTTTVGQKGLLSRFFAFGGPAGGGTAGGAGGAGLIPSGVAATGAGGGGGGGAIGRIRINTRTGAVTMTNAMLSPGPGDPGSAYSAGSALLR